MLGTARGWEPVLRPLLCPGLWELASSGFLPSSPQGTPGRPAALSLLPRAFCVLAKASLWGSTELSTHKSADKHLALLRPSSSFFGNMQENRSLILHLEIMPFSIPFTLGP